MSKGRRNAIERDVGRGYRMMQNPLQEKRIPSAGVAGVGLSLSLSERMKEGAKAG